MEWRRFELAADAVDLGSARNQVAHDLETIVDGGPVQKGHVFVVHLVYVYAHHLNEFANPECNETRILLLNKTTYYKTTLLEIWS